MSSSGSILEKSSWRSSLIFVLFGATASFFSIVLLVIATAADHWVEIIVDREAVHWVDIIVDMEAVRGNLTQLIETNQVRYYSRTSGLFRTCFPSLAHPTAGVYLSLMGERCTTNPAWTPPSISSSASFTSPTSNSDLQLELATPLLLLISVTTLSISFLLFVSSCWSKSSTRLVVTAVLQLLGSALAAAAMATWHSAWFLHDLQLHKDGLWPDWLRQATQTSLGWSYFVAWAGLALSLVASLASATAAALWRKRRKLYREDHDRAELSHICGAPCHSTSINHNMPPCPAQTPRHSMLSYHSRSSSQGTCHSRPHSRGTCHSRPYSHGTCHSKLPSHGTFHSRPSSQGTYHSRPSSHGTFHSRPSSHGTCHRRTSSHVKTICHHKPMPSDELRLGFNHICHSSMSRSCSSLDRARIPHQKNDRTFGKNCGRIYSQGCECCGNLSCEGSRSERSSSRQKSGKMSTQGCECRESLNCGRSTSEGSLSRQKSHRIYTQGCDYSGNPSCECGENPSCECSGNPSCECGENPSCESGGNPSCECSGNPSCECSGNPSCECSGNVSCECSGNLSSDRSTSEMSLSRQKSIKWLHNWETGNPANEINSMNGALTSRGTQNHQRLIKDSKRFVEKGGEIMSYEAGEAVDGTVGEEYGIRIDESFAVEGERNDAVRIDETFVKKSDKIPHSKEWYNKIYDSEYLDTSRIEPFNIILHNEDLDNSRNERYKNISHSEDWDRSEIYNKMPHSEEWHTSRIERYNKKMLRILKNTMHSSDKYIREMLEF